MSGRILNDNDFEGLKLYEEDASINKEVTPLMRKIVGRLFQGTELNLDDFYFTVFEEASANAFFIDKEKTEGKKKNIVAISRGLLDSCNNEDELAGIIGHECGHYVWSEILGGENTIFQERAADLRAVDLLINGGYNPLNHLNICKRIFGGYGSKRYYSPRLDVHGNGLSRVGDIEARLTMIADERGNFPPVSEQPDQEYLAVREKAQEAYAKEGYDTYLDKCLKKAYGSKDLEALSAEQIMTVIYNELEAGNMEMEARRRSIYDCVGRLSEAKRFDDKSSELIDLCQKVFMKMHKETEAWDNYEKHMFGDRSAKEMLKRFKLQPFGDFAAQVENIKNLANYTSKEDVLHYVDEMYNLRWTVCYADSFDDFEWPKVGPKGKDNIGKKLPEDQFEEWRHELGVFGQVKKFDWMMQVLGFEKEDDYIDRYCFSKRYDRSEYFLNDDKIVLVFGGEAKRLNAEQENKEFLDECEKAKKDFDKKIDFWDKLAKFSTTKNEEEKKSLAIQLVEQLSEKYSLRYGYRGYKERFDIFDLPMYVFNSDVSNPDYVHDPYIEGVYTRFNTSSAKKVFCSKTDARVSEIYKESYSYEREMRKERLKSELGDDKDKLQRALTTLDDDDMMLDIISQTSVCFCRGFRDKICDSLIELAEYVGPEKNGTTKKEGIVSLEDGYECAIYIYDAMDNIIENFKVKCDAVYSSEVRRLKAEFDIATDKIQRKRLEAACRYHQFANLFKLPLPKQETKGEEVKIEELSVKAKNYICEDFGHHRRSPILETVMQFFGFDGIDNTDIDAVIKRLDHLTGHLEKDSLYNETAEAESKLADFDSFETEDVKKFWKGTGILITANALRSGKDFDLKKVLKYIRHCKSSLEWMPILNSPEVTDIFAEAIAKHNKFHEMSLKDKIYVYEMMEDLKLFSEKYANKAEYFKTIVKDIENHPDHNEAMEITEKLLSLQYAAKPLKENKLKHSDIEFLKEKEALIAFYAKGKADILGIDDGSNAYYEKTVAMAEEICAPMKVIRDERWGSDFVDHERFPRRTLQAIMDRISTNIVSQELTTQMLSEKGSAKYSQEDADTYDYTARLAEKVIKALAQSPETAKATIDFLGRKCTRESIDKFFADIKTSVLSRGKKIEELNVTIDKFSLQLLHENFWHADLPVRAYLMNKILKAYSQEDEKVLNLVVDMHFDKDSSYYTEAKRVVKAVFDHLQPYERDLVLAALVSANQRDSNNTQTSGEAIGEGLKMFFENKGPAFVKFGQLLSYLPVLDAEIRKPLAKLRDKADIPSRDELFNLMKETLPNEELAKISRVGKILGAGSFFITTEIEYDGKPCVVALMRPYAKDLVQSGMDMIYATIEDLAKQDSMYKPLLNVANQARLSAMSETDIEVDHAKYVEAVKIYEGIKITTPQGEYKPEVAKWISYGKGKDDQVYKILSMAEGQAMTSSKMSEQTKHDMAVAYVALELANLLAGGKWDTDRHQGQQKLAENGFKKFVIGIFDTGAQMLKSPKFKDKVMLGGLLYGMARAAKSGENIADYMIKKVKRIDKAGGRLNIDTLYIDEVQRGLTALSDIINYQKEIKDEKGNVVQPEKSLTAKEIGDIMAAVLNSGLVDKHVKMTIAAKAMFNKIRVAKKGWFETLKEGLKKMTSSIKIEKSDDKNPYPEAKRSDKPEKEIKELQGNKNTVLGVNTKHIKRKGNPPKETVHAAFRS